MPTRSEPVVFCWYGKHTCVGVRSHVGNAQDYISMIFLQVSQRERFHGSYSHDGSEVVNEESLPN